MVKSIRSIDFVKSLNQFSDFLSRRYISRYAEKKMHQNVWVNACVRRTETENCRFQSPQQGFYSSFET